MSELKKEIKKTTKRPFLEETMKLLLPQIAHIERMLSGTDEKGRAGRERDENGARDEKVIDALRGIMKAIDERSEATKIAFEDIKKELREIKSNNGQSSESVKKVFDEFMKLREDLKKREKDIEHNGAQDEAKKLRKEIEKIREALTTTQESSNTEDLMKEIRQLRTDINTEKEHRVDKSDSLVLRELQAIRGSVEKRDKEGNGREKELKQLTTGIQKVKEHVEILRENEDASMKDKDKPNGLVKEREALEDHSSKFAFMQEQHVRVTTGTPLTEQEKYTRLLEWISAKGHLLAVREDEHERRTILEKVRSLNVSNL